MHEKMAVHPEECPDVEITCPSPGCSVKVFRRQLVAHKNVCPKAKIDCPYRKLGCEKSRVLRKDLQKHLSESSEHHLTVVREEATYLRGKLESVRREIELRSSPLTPSK